MSLPTPTLPSGDGAYTFVGGGLTVNLPKTITSDAETLSGTVYHEQIPGLDGLYATRTPTWNGKSLSLSGFVYDSAKVQSIKRAMSFKRGTLVRDTYYLPVDIVSFSLVEVIYDSIWRLEVEMESPREYWESSTQVEEVGSPYTVINQGDFAVRPQIILTVGVGGLTRATFYANGRMAEWTGTAVEGDAIVIDCNALSVKLNGDNALDSMNDSFFVNPPLLIPGSNEILSDFDGAATYEVRFFERYM